MDPHGTTPHVKSNETMIAIVASGVIAIIVTLVLVGNPFRAIGDAYTDYGVKTPATGAAPASTVTAPTGK